MTDEEDQLKYTVRLLIRHPNVAPDLITKTLGLTPHLQNLAGSPRRSPTGTALPGVYDMSKWGYSVQVENERSFFRSVANLIDALEPHSGFLSGIVDTNGTVDLIVDLPGDVNIGDVIPWRVLARLAALKIDLGIEVFPEFN